MGDFYYRRNVDKALNGMQGLTLEERGAYNTILDLIYLKKNKLENDDAFMCRWLGCDIRVWRRLRERLIELEKVYLTPDGFIRNKTADDEINSRASAKNPQENPQADFFAQKNHAAVQHTAQVRPKFGGSSPEVRPKSEAQSIENNNLQPVSRARANSISNSKIKTSTSFLSSAREVEVLKNGSGMKRSFDVVSKLTDDGFEAARKAAPQWDIHRLASIFNENITAGRLNPPDKPDKAFPAWCGKYTKGKPP